MSSKGSQFNASHFDFGPEQQLVPQGEESLSWFSGYYLLELNERYASAHAASLHRSYIITWYRLLDAYYRALDIPGVTIGSVTALDVLWLTGWKILRLGLCAAKGALDAALAGYYVGAFA